jgi:hypothetical protein
MPCKMRCCGHGGGLRASRQRCWVASVLDVVTVDGDRIAEVTGFVTAELLSRWGQEDDRFVGATTFPRFGLPAVLPR